jgi:sugar lactone lactonase YvrE
MRTQRKLLVLAAVLLGTVAPIEASASQGSGGLDRTRLAAGLEGGAGSTVGPDGALYVTETVAGRISRIDPRSGRVTTFADGLPPRVIPIGGAMDVAFLGRTAYAIVTLVGSDVGGSDVVGLYRVDGRHRVTVVADVGAFAIDNPPSTPFDQPTGLQYAMEPYRGGFLITDGHHNRVLYVTRHGEISVVAQFGNTVPTGLARSGHRVYMAEAGAVPHVPEDGKVLALHPRSGTATEVASGAPLLVDVEAGRRNGLYALSQGVFGGGNPGTPALPNTGSLVRANRSGGFTVLAGGLDRPTSLELIGRSAYVVTLTGEVWRLR